MNVQDQKLEGTIADLQQRLDAANQRNRETQANLENASIELGEAQGQLKRKREELEAAERNLELVVEAHGNLGKQLAEFGKEINRRGAWKVALDVANQRIKELETALAHERRAYDNTVIERDAEGRNAEEAERKLSELQDAISPSRKGMVDDGYYVKVAQRMRERESPISNALAQIEQPQKFDIRDGKNQYAPCPQCKSEYEMGLVTKRLRLAVQCMRCGYRGPEVKNDCNSDSDKAAFDAWNAIARLEQPPTVIDTPADHALSELYKDQQFIKEYRARLGIEQPQRSPIPPVHPMAGIAAIDRKAQAKLPGEDPDEERCQCSACVALRTRAQAERTP